MSYSANLRISIETDDGLDIELYKSLLAARKVFAPAKVQLEAGEIRSVQLAHALTAEASPKASLFLVVTDAPGVLCSIGQNSTDYNVRSSGWLLTGTEDRLSQAQSGLVTPVFTSGGCWLNHLPASVAAYKWIKCFQYTRDPTLHEQQFHYGGDYVRAETDVDAGDAGNPNVIAAYIWGRNNYVNLGTVNDGKLFQFWFSPDTPLEAANMTYKLQLISYPFSTGLPDDEIPAALGVTTDVEVVKYATQAPYFEASFQTQLDSTYKASLVTLKKSDFSRVGWVTGGETRYPVWSRITQLRILGLAGAYSPPAGKFTFSAIYFGDPPDAEVNSVSLFTRKLTSRQGVTVNLQGPSDRAATVWIYGVLH